MRYVFCAAVAGVFLLTGCIPGPYNDFVRPVLCGHDGTRCPRSPGLWYVAGPEISADGSEVTVPFWCYLPKQNAPVARAATLTLATSAWRPTPYDADALHKKENRPNDPAIPGDPGTHRSCAAECSRFVYRAEVKSSERGQFLEVFYSDNGEVRQITRFHVKGDPVGLPVLSPDGKRIAVQYLGALAVIETADGSERRFEYKNVALDICAMP